jgi:hypothetical protein
MKKLYDEFKIERGVMSGQHFMKRYEAGEWYVYQVTDKHNQFRFEVFKKRYRKGNEVYPLTSDFRKGANAFICSKLDTAIAFIDNHDN